MQNSLWVRIIGAILSAVSIVFVAKVMGGAAMRGQYSLVSWSEIRVLLLFFPVSCGMAFLMVYPWKWVLEFVLKRRIRLKEIFAVYAGSNVAKYWPGGFWQYLMRNFLGRNLNMTQWQIGTSSLLEILCVVIGTGTIVFFIAAARWSYSRKLEYAPVELQRIFDYSGIFILIALLCVILIKFWLSRSLRTQNVKFDYWEMGGLFLKVTVAHFIYFVLASVSFAFFLREFTVDAIGMLDAWVVGEVFILAFFAGFVVPGAPSGLGIREVFLLFALSPHYGTGPVLLAAFCHRFLLILGDVGIWILSRFNLSLSNYVSSKI